MSHEPLRIMVVSGSRADWGYLSVPLALLRDDSSFALSLVVTGQHLDAASGNSASVIAGEGFTIAARVAMTPEGDNPQAVTSAMGNGLADFSDVIAALKPEVMLLLGDRYEILVAATAAMMARVPIAHLAGGDITEGAIDDAIRHAISKMAHLHFPTNTEAAKRLARLGENPAHIHAVGSTGLDRLLKVRRLARDDLFARIGFTPRRRNLLVTLHPVTLDADPLHDAEAALEALHGLGDEFGIIFTGSNADVGGTTLSGRLREFVQSHENAILHPSLGSELYVNAITHCDAVLGNSSSGLYEAPSLKVTTVNIGTRQNGRLRATSVIDCEATAEAIRSAIAKALTLDCSATVNPYGDGHAAERIVTVLKQIGDPASLLRKRFHLG